MAISNGTGKSGVSDAIATLRQDVGAIGDDVRGVATEVRKEVRRKMKDVREEGSERAAAALHEAENRVRERPAAALGLAAGAGFVLGLLLARR